MTSNFLIENEEQDITHFEDHILIACLSYFKPKYVWFPVHLKSPEIPDPSGQLAELIVYITSTRVDLYCHQILFEKYTQSAVANMLVNYIKAATSMSYKQYTIRLNCTMWYLDIWFNSLRVKLT